MSKADLLHSHDLVDFVRPPIGRCLGAVFASYDFDEAFFESVLATLLPIHADPDTDPDRFVDEGRRRLRETPVTVLVDGYRARGGHRLPFDLVSMPPRIAFHPKLSLTLFEDHARLLIGSANLTEGGFGSNAELMAQCQLDYRRDAVLLSDVRDLILACGAKGESWERFAAQLKLLMADGSGKRQATALGSRVLHSSSGMSPIDQLLDALPKKSKIVGVSMLLGMQPEDDPVAETEVLDRFLDKLTERSKRLPPFELGLPWEGNPVTAPGEPITQPVETLIGQLCARFQTEGTAGTDSGTVDYFLALGEQGTSLVCQVGSQTRLFDKEMLQEELATLRCWPISEVVGVGPVASIERLLERAEARVFVFPELRLAQGQVFRRALHAKLIALRTVEGTRERTHLLVGAPNFERFADESNTVVEAAFYEARDGHLTLERLSAELVPAPVEQLYLQNRPLPAPTPLHVSPLEAATFDAHTRTLLMEFTPGTKQVQVIYQTRQDELELVSGEPRLREQVTHFPLDRHSAELRVDVGEESWLVPIAFRNLPELVCDEPRAHDANDTSGTLPFWDFVDFLCGRDRHAPQASGDLPDERVAPQRVFRAIAALVAEVANVGVSLGAFDVACRGPTGLMRFAERWFNDSETLLDQNEAWLYGQELARALGSVRFGQDATSRYKANVIEAFVVELRRKLAKIAERAEYLKTLERFYRDDTRNGAQDRRPQR